MYLHRNVDRNEQRKNRYHPIRALVSAYGTGVLVAYLWIQWKAFRRRNWIGR